MRILESRLGWNVGKKPSRQERRRPVRYGDGAPELLLQALGYHEVCMQFDAVGWMG